MKKRTLDRMILMLSLMAVIVLALAEAIRPMAVLLAASFGVVQCMQGHDPEGRVPLSGLRHALSKGWLCLLVMLLPYRPQAL